MPNHVKNVVKFKHLKPEDVDYIVNRIAHTYPEREETGIDFDLIIPEPRYIQDCPKDCRVNKDSHVEEDIERPWFDWYAWHNKYWGTKWNAYDLYIQKGETFVTFVFSTAWNAPFPIIEALFTFGYDMTIKYADEDYGSNCGVIEYDAEADDTIIIHSTDMPNPTQFAERLWENY